MNSIKGLNYFKDNKGEIDIVVTDQTMPNLTGIELAKKILELEYDIPVILCSGYSDFGNDTVNSDHGIDVFLDKPFDDNLLLQHVSKLIR